MANLRNNQLFEFCMYIITLFFLTISLVLMCNVTYNLRDYTEDIHHSKFSNPSLGILKNLTCQVYDSWTPPINSSNTTKTTTTVAASYDFEQMTFIESDHDNNAFVVLTLFGKIPSHPYY